MSPNYDPKWCLGLNVQANSLFSECAPEGIERHQLTEQLLDIDRKVPSYHFGVLRPPVYWYSSSCATATPGFWYSEKEVPQVPCIKLVYCTSKLVPSEHPIGSLAVWPDQHLAAVRLMMCDTLRGAFRELSACTKCFLANRVHCWMLRHARKFGKTCFSQKEPNKPQKVVTSGCKVFTSGPEICVKMGISTVGMQIKLENIHEIFQIFDYLRLKGRCTTYRKSETETKSIVTY